VSVDSKSKKYNIALPTPPRITLAAWKRYTTAAEEPSPVIDWSSHPLRSLLFAPGNHPRRLEKVGGFGSDAIVLDLEDAVADSEKTAARELVHAALPTYDEDTIVVVRVNGHETGRLDDDLLAIVGHGLDCVMVPKVERPETLLRVDAMLTALEHERGLPRDGIRILCIIETSRGLVRCEEIAGAASPRLVTLIFGLGDFSVELGVDLTPTGEELLYARSRVVVAARAASLQPPLDGPFLDIEDIAGLEADTRRSRQLGFQGRVVIHPGQVEPVQRVFAELSDEDAAHCRRVVEEFEAAEAQGLASIQIDGRFVDYPLYHRARHRLALFETTRRTVGS
jgi:citrate lyase subunit beta/citryl-CoA lyase